MCGAVPKHLRASVEFSVPFRLDVGETGDFRGLPEKRTGGSSSTKKRGGDGGGSSSSGSKVLKRP